MSLRDLPISERLRRLGYEYHRDDLTPKDCRLQITMGGCPIDRMNWQEAAAFCARYERDN